MTSEAKHQLTIFLGGLCEVCTSCVRHFVVDANGLHMVSTRMPGHPALASLARGQVDMATFVLQLLQQPLLGLAVSSVVHTLQGAPGWQSSMGAGLQALFPNPSA